MLQKHLSYVFIILVTLELSFLPILSSVGASNMGPIPLLFFTFLTASIVSFGMLLYKKKTLLMIETISKRKAFSVIAAAGLLNYAVAQLFLTLGVLGTNPIIASLVLKLWPIFMVIMLPFTLKTEIQSSQVIALLLGFLAVYLLITDGTLSLNGTLGLTIPIILILISTLATATSNIIIRSHNYDLYVQVFIFNFASLILFAILFVVGGFWSGFGTIDIYSIISFLFLGAITYSVGAFMYFYALKRLNPVFAPSAGYATPFLTIFFSVALLGTKVYSYYFYALAILLVALILQQISAKKAQRYLSKKKGIDSPVLFDVTGAFTGSQGTRISKYMKGDGRALAIVLPSDMSAEYSYDETEFYDKYMLFSSNAPHHEVLKEELDFIKESTNAKNDEILIIGIGNAYELEQKLTEMPGKRFGE